MVTCHAKKNDTGKNRVVCAFMLLKIGPSPHRNQSNDVAGFWVVFSRYISFGCFAMKYLPNYLEKKICYILVGDVNPSEKYAIQIGSFPQGSG